MMNMKINPVILVLFLMAFGLPSLAQNNNVPCTLGVEGSPTLRNMRLGMSAAEISRAVKFEIKPVSKSTFMFYKKVGTEYERFDLEDPEEIRKQVLKVTIGESYYDLKINPETKIPLLFKDLELVYLKFYKEKLYSMNILYAGKTYNWTDVGDFVNIFSEKVGLGQENWQIGKMGVAHLTCKGFDLTAVLSSPGDGVMVTLENPAVEKSIEADGLIELKRQDRINSGKYSESREDFKP